MKFPYVYPDPQSRILRDALALDSGLESEYILVGCGADELIDLIMRYGLWRFGFYFSFHMNLTVTCVCCRCVLDPGEKIIDCPPTFSMYAFDAAVNDAGVIRGEWLSVLHSL